MLTIACAGTCLDAHSSGEVRDCLSRYFPRTGLGKGGHAVGEIETRHRPHVDTYHLHDLFSYLLGRHRDICAKQKPLKTIPREKRVASHGLIYIAPPPSPTNDKSIVKPQLRACIVLYRECHTWHVIARIIFTLSLITLDRLPRKVL